MVHERQRQLLAARLAALGDRALATRVADPHPDVGDLQRAPDGLDHLLQHVLVGAGLAQAVHQPAHRGVRLGTQAVETAPDPALEAGPHRLEGEGDHGGTDQGRDPAGAVAEQGADADHDEVRRRDQRS